jgi:hypothetical protein
MLLRRRPNMVALVIALAWTASLYAQKEKKQDEAEKKETQAMRKLIDDMGANPSAPNDLDLSWTRADFLKAQSNKEFVPFTVSIDPSKVTGGSIAFYWRVVAKGGAAEPAAQAAKKDDKDKKDSKDSSKDSKDKKSEFAWEDVSFVTVAAGQAPLRIARSFMVAAGEYDVFMVAKEPTPEKAPKNAPAPKMSVVKQTITVPDFWNSELNTSSLIVAQRIDPLPAPLTPDQLRERPYGALGQMEIVPVYGDLKFEKKSELSTFMLVYNPKTDSANKPDISIDYVFCQTAAGSEPQAGEPCKSGEKFFNKTNAQNFNAQTLPPQFDLAAGYQIQTGQAVPLATFPEGQYRLEIKVTDKIANKSLIRDVNFTVGP